MRRQDWLLMVAGLAGQTRLTPVQLQKSLFLIRELVPAARTEDDFYTFEPYNYGPFCPAIYSDAEVLESEGYVSITLSPAGRWREYAATPPGRARARELAAELPPEDKEYSKELVRFVQSISFRQLLRTIYERWPEYKGNSIFTG